MWHTYISKIPDSNGIFHWTLKEDKTWEVLINRQYDTIRDRACKEFIKSLNIVNFGTWQVPQHSELSSKLEGLTGWTTVAVPALIREDFFFSLLAKKKFPCTSFIRIAEELDYLEEPDIFHEFFWHIPLLTWWSYARFLERFGQFFIHCDKRYRIPLTRIFWFTVEFWLIRRSGKMRVYGAGILSSHSETKRALEDPDVERTRYDTLTCARTPYRYGYDAIKVFFYRRFRRNFFFIRK